MNISYKKALSEVNEILKYVDDDVVSRIPRKFISFIEEKMEPNYKFEIQEGLNLSEQPISNEARAILAMIYRDYICSAEEKNVLLSEASKELEKIELAKREKFNPNNLFLNKNNNKV